jgi:formate hydrogenlyase transcriptional activator
MSDFAPDGSEQSARQQYRTLLGVSQVIASQRDLSTLFHELADQLHQVVRFDHLILVLHDATTNTLRVSVLEASDGSSLPVGFSFPVEDSPAGFVWRSQQPLITSNVAAEDRWHAHMEVVQSYGIRSKCDLPLTTARRRLGSLVFACKQPAAFDAADLDFLQQVANQVAVAVDNALAFQEIQALKDQLAQAKDYLEEEIRTDHFKEMVAVSAALREALRKVEIVAPTDSTVLICG